MPQGKRITHIAWCFNTPPTVPSTACSHLSLQHACALIDQKSQDPAKTGVPTCLLQFVSQSLSAFSCIRCNEHLLGKLYKVPTYKLTRPFV